MRLGLVFLVLALHRGDASAGQQPRGLSLHIEGQGPWFVGQTIELRLSADFPINPRDIEAPRPSDAEIHSQPGQSQVEAEENKSEIYYILIAKRSGDLLVAPFQLRRGGETLQSASLRISIRPVPTSGRTAAFLGGVGALTVTTSANPTHLRVGQTVDVTLSLQGPGAWGSQHAPELLEENTRPSSFQVGRLSSELEPAMPRRVFRYRVRALETGRLVIPPVAVSTFDATTQRFMTWRSRSLELEVEPLERLESDELSSGIARKQARYLPLWLAWIGLSALAAGIAALVWQFRRRHSVSQPKPAAQPLALACSELNKLAGSPTPMMAARIDAILADLLHALVPEVVGPLAPDQAAVALAHLTGDDELARGLADLLAECQWHAYSRTGREAGDVSTPTSDASALKAAALSWIARALKQVKSR